MPTQSSQKRKTHQVLEDKLKMHIQREFDLGEKVISLLKQKKELETNLQTQLGTKEGLEKELTDAIESKRALEQKYSDMQRNLHAQQKNLRQRSRRFGATEEDSREDLKALREEIRRLKQQLEILDIQKVEEHVRLSNEIEGLCGKERQLKQQLQQISYQKELAEEELDIAAQQCQKLSEVHGQEKAQHEQEIERLQRKQAHLEIRIAHILDEQHRNERTVQQEIETLKHSKAQLEEKVEHLEHQQAQPSQGHTTELRQVIEQKEQAIQMLQAKAHQRSAMLRSENESLRKEMENILTKREEMGWENQMLESSLKNLQHDLAEYLLLKNKYEEAQREKEHFEEMFYEKIQFLEERYMDASQKASRKNVREMKFRTHKQTLSSEAAGTTKSVKARRRTGSSRTQKISRRTGTGFWLKLAIPVAVIIAIFLGIFITRLFLLDGDQSGLSHTAGELPVRGFELPDDKFGMGEPVDSDISGNFADPSNRQPSRQRPPAAEVQDNSQTQPYSEESNVMQLANNLIDGTKTNRGTNTVISSTQVKKSSQALPPVDIVVELPGTGNSRFLPKERQSFPTVENNVVLRRHYNQIHLASQKN